jgi:hypothetical protein
VRYACCKHNRLLVQNMPLHSSGTAHTRSLSPRQRQLLAPPLPRCAPPDRRVCRRNRCCLDTHFAPKFKPALFIGPSHTCLASGSLYQLVLLKTCSLAAAAW